MRRVIALSLAVVTAVLAQPVAAKPRAPAAEAAPFSRQEAILKWINDYRADPEPAKLPAAIRAMGTLGLLRDLDAAGLYVGFTAGVLGSNPDSAERLVSKSFPLPPEDQVLLVKAIAYSGLPNWRDLMGSFVERMPARLVLIRSYLYGDAKTLDELPLDSGTFALDAHWGFYLATGRPEPVRRIVSALAWSAERNNVERLTIGSMAKWTLATNATRDTDLLAILKAEINTQPDEVRAPLREVIMAAETFETGQLRKDALAAIEVLKAKGPQLNRDYAWWGQAGQTALALGCITAGALGHVEVGVPCVIGGALSSAALKVFTPTGK